MQLSESLPTGFKIQVYKHSSKFEELTDSTFLLLQSINWFVKSSALTSPFLTPLSRSPYRTHRARRCGSTQSKHELFISQKYKIQIYFHIFSLAPSIPGAPDLQAVYCKQSVLTGNHKHDKRLLHSPYRSRWRQTVSASEANFSQPYFWLLHLSPVSPWNLCRRLPLNHLLCPYEICRKQSVNSRAARRLELPEWLQGKVTSEWKM